MNIQQGSTNYLIDYNLAKVLTNIFLATICLQFNNKDLFLLKTVTTFEKIIIILLFSTLSFHFVLLMSVSSDKNLLEILKKKKQYAIQLVID